MVTFSFSYFSFQPMAERLLIRALKGGENTKIVTLNGKKMTKMPSTLEKLPGLRTLNLQNNLIPKVCSEIRTLTQVRNSICFWNEKGKQERKEMREQ